MGIYDRLRILSDYLDSFSVEIQGEYTQVEIEDGVKYMGSAKTWSVLWWTAIFPLIPSVMSMYVLIPVPLKPPTLPVSDQIGFLVMTAVDSLIVILSLLWNAVTIFRSFDIHIDAWIPISSALSFSILYLIVIVIAGTYIAFPVPFSAILCATPPGTIALGTMMGVLYFKYARNVDQQSRRNFTKAAIQFIILFYIVNIINLLYQGLAILQQHIQEWIFLLIIQLVKIILKKALFYSLKHLPTSLRSVYIVYLAEFYHAMYLALFIKNENEGAFIMIATLVVDALQNGLLILQLFGIRKKIGTGNQHAVRSSVTDKERRIVVVDDRDKSIRTRPDQTMSRIYREGNMSQFRARSYHCVVMILMAEHCELVAKAVYLIVTILVWHSENKREYTPTLQNMSSEDLRNFTSKMLTVIGIEGLIFAVTCLCFARVFRIKPMYQLAYIFSKHSITIFGLECMNIYCTLALVLVHHGADYTFQFDWIRK